MARHFYTALMSLVLMATAACGGGGAGSDSGAPADLAEGISTEIIPPEDQDSGNLVPPSVVIVDPGAGRDHAGPDWTQWPESLALKVLDVNNVYEGDNQALSWPDDASGIYSNRSNCSGFVTRSLMKAFQLTGDDFIEWMGGKGPSSARYHDNIVAQNNFQRIHLAPDVRRGDIVAIKYPEGMSGTGHTMIAAGTPVRRTVATAPDIPGTVQYELRIIDSTSSPHSLDTRSATLPAGPNGAGLGTMRLYAHETSGVIVGYTWSLSSGSKYYNPTTPTPEEGRSLVVGRLTFTR